MGTVISKSLRSVRREWHEAPWFVLFIIAIAALIAQITFAPFDGLF